MHLFRSLGHGSKHFRVLAPAQFFVDNPSKVFILTIEILFFYHLAPSFGEFNRAIKHQI